MLSLTLTLIFLLIALIKIKQIPTSISEISYLWSPKVFSVYCVLLAITLLIPWLAITPITYQFICFLSCVGIIACGTTPFFKESFEGKIHYTGGVIAMLCWLIWMILGGYWIALILFAVITLILILIKPKCWVFFGELVGLIILTILL